MKARLPEGYGKGPGNMASMMRQAQKMQDEMAKAQEELAATEYTASVGGGAVEATVTGKKELKALSIKPEVVDPEDIEMLQDLVISAVNEALRNAEDDHNARMEKITGGLDIGSLGSLGLV